MDNLKHALKPSLLIPIVLIVSGFVIVFAVGLRWINSKGRPPRFRGFANLGSYYRIMPDFTCASKRMFKSELSFANGAWTAATTNPFDCSMVKSFLATPPEISFDRSYVGLDEAIFQFYPSAPDLMQTVPPTTELWCRLAENPNFDIYVVGDQESWNSQIVLAEFNAKDGSFLVEKPITVPVARTLNTGRLQFIGDGVDLEADLRTKTTGGRLGGRAKIDTNGVKFSGELACRSPLKPGSSCPIGYTDLLAKKGLLTENVCLAKEANAPTSDREAAKTGCRKLGPGFELLREEERLVARSESHSPNGDTKNLDERAENLAKEWVMDPEVTPPRSPAPFRCVFHPKRELPITIFSALMTPSLVSSEGLPIEVGTRFKSDKSGFVKAVRFYRSVADASGYTVHLWDEKGLVLATATGSDQQTPGWQTVTFAEPAAITANQVYTTSYYTAVGRVSFEAEGLARSRSRGLGLTAEPDGGVSMTNGGYPSRVDPGHVNYAVDVIFE